MEDEPVPDLLSKKELLKSNWDDEDLDEDGIKDSWEVEEEPAKPLPPPEKAVKKTAAKPDEKKVKAVEAIQEVPLDPLEEKLRQQRYHLHSRATTELFSKKGDEKTLDNFIPNSESDFLEYAELISHKLRPYEKSYHYIGLLKAVMRLSLTFLKGADAEEVASSITAIKAEKEANASKKKTVGKKKQLLSLYVMVMMVMMTMILCEPTLFPYEHMKRILRPVSLYANLKMDCSNIFLFFDAITE
ncbi:eukaryotic translation initiation factor 3 subunit J-A-like [Salvia hispanica]|uniref:eukaryotic translation initiation factor 3 subunit J-A-like n=1 Tax=Salvia hispanica TaxID=49212 RepID=UPI0020095113|nr:eukaryotic translation initiation factor 3 subunit J-A-like [Salvia hispanica]